MEYQLIRSARRKTVALQVSNSKVIVRAPKFVNTAYIDSLIKLKTTWLEQKITQQKKQALLSPQYTLQALDANQINKPSIYIDGLPHKIIIDFGKKCIIHNKEDNSITVILNPRYQRHGLSSDLVIAKVKSDLEGWFKESIESYIKHNLARYSQQTSLYSTSYKVRKYKARWGSCNNRGELSFNYLLKMLPNWVVDYVIVHELCHLKYMNHSNKFWLLVAQYFPEYQNAKQWISEHQAFLRWP